MDDLYTGEEKREFYRVTYEKELNFNKFIGSSVSAANSGISKNISQSGILIQTNDPPSISNLLWISLDLRTLNICQEIEHNALIIKNGIIGKVVRLEESKNAEGSYDVGVCFLKKGSLMEEKLAKVLA